MQRIRFPFLRRAAAVTLLLGLRAGLLPAREVVVLDVKGTAAWTRGQVLAEGTSVQLPEGAELTAVTEEEKVLRLRGPLRGRIPRTRGAQGAGTAGGREESLLLRGLAAVLAVRGALEAVLTRGEGDALASDPWLIDLTTGGEKCVARGGAPRLWHPAPREPTSLWVKALGRDLDELSEWPAGAEVVPWPERMPIADGRRYLVTSPALPQERSLTLHLAPTAFSSQVEAATWMFSQQCNDQALRLLSGLPEAAAAGEPHP